jgi:hypothetical protein
MMNYFLIGLLGLIAAEHYPVFAVIIITTLLIIN